VVTSDVEILCARARGGAGGRQFGMTALLAGVALRDG
jgi:hypothetical protein